MGRRSGRPRPVPRPGQTPSGTQAKVDPPGTGQPPQVPNTPRTTNSPLAWQDFMEIPLLSLLRFTGEELIFNRMPEGAFLISFSSARYGWKQP